MKRLISIFLVFSILCSVSVSAAPEALTIEGVYVIANETTRVSSRIIDGEAYLFLPPTTDLNAVTLHYSLSVSGALLSVKGAKAASAAASGTPIDLISLCGDESPYRLTVFASCDGQETSMEVTLVPTNGIAAMYLVSEDPINEGREWVEASPTKDNKAKGTMLLVNETGKTVYDGALTQIKGRGNSTWLADKKPYQIKLEEKTDLLETGKDENRSKTWVLLTNHSDAALLRNQIVYDLSVSMGMQPAIECRAVNLYYDGEYRGAYLLCEKVEIGSGRVDISDLEGDFEESNPDIDFDTLSTQIGTTANGASYIYCPDLKTPENYTEGYLLEMDTAVRAQAEKCYFITTRGNYIVVKSPEFCSKEAMDYIATYYQEFEDTVYNEGVHPTNGKTLSDYASIEALAQCYIVNELTKNPDSYRTSAYFYKDSDLLNAGPIWDYDLSFGYGWGDYIAPCANPEEYFTLRSAFGEALYHIPAFRESVRTLYFDIVAPLITGTLLPSLPDYQASMQASAYANNLVWGRSTSAWGSACNDLTNYITTRSAWLSSAFSTWNAESYEPLNVYLDVSEESWYYEAALAAREYGLMNGMNFSIFSPAGLSTRGQTAKVLFEMSGAEAPAYSQVFPDVSDGVWYTPAILWAQENGVVKGYGDGSFRPNAQISRQELVVLLYRFLGEPTVEEDALSRFTDAGNVMDYARDAMTWAVSVGIVEGYTDNTLRPRQTVTRAELAALMVRYYEQFVLTPTV